MAGSAGELFKALAGNLVRMIDAGHRTGSPQHHLFNSSTQNRLIRIGFFGVMGHDNQIRVFGSGIF